MYRRSSIIVLLLALAATMATMATMSLANRESSGPRQSDMVPGGRANFALAERFSDQEIYRLLYGQGKAENGNDSNAPADKYIKFSTIVVRPEWISGSSAFWYAVKKNGAYQYYIVDPREGTKKILFDPEKVSKTVNRQLGTAFKLSEDIPDSFRVTDDGELLEFGVGRNRIQFEQSTATAQQQKTPEKRAYEFVPPSGEFSESPDGRYIVYSVENNLYVHERGGKEYQLTSDGEKWYGYSQQVGSHDSQKPLQGRMSWLGNSGKFFVERWDNRKVAEMWYLDSLTEPRPTLRTTRFAMPGERDVPIQELWIFDAQERTGFRIETDKWPGQFIGDMDIGSRGFTVAKDGDHIYFARMSRGFHEVELLKVDANTGNVQVLLSEAGEPYFTIRFPTFALLNDSQEFVWLSDRSGRNHYYLYDESGGPKSAVTGGDFTASRIAYLDEADRSMVIGAFGKDPEAYPFHRQYYKVSIDGGDPLQLTPEDATHEAFFSPDGKFFVDNYSRADQAPTAVLRDANGELVMHLDTLDTGNLLETGFRLPEYFTAKAADGETDLFGVLWKPADFDSSRSYPLIAAVQPNAIMSGADFGRFRPGNVAVQLSQLGFVIAEFRTRGQGRHVRDKKYILHSYNNERDFPLADAKTVLEQLGDRYDYLDMERVGVYGHSGGGFMAAALCMTYPSLFKTCVSSSGNHDNRIAEQNSSEFHWGVRQTIEEDQETGSSSLSWVTNLHPNQDLAHGLNSHLLIIHGDNDTDTHFSHSVRLADALIKANKRFDFMVMPSKDHEYGDYNGYFDRLRWAYFAEHLMGDRRHLVDLGHPISTIQ